MFLIAKEVYWRQRSRVQWLSKGDNSTRFIHKTSNSKRRMIRIQASISSNFCWNGVSLEENQGGCLLRECPGPGQVLYGFLVLP